MCLLLYIIINNKYFCPLVKMQEIRVGNLRIELVSCPWVHESIKETSTNEPSGLCLHGGLTILHHFTIERHNGGGGFFTKELNAITRFIWALFPIMTHQIVFIYTITCHSNGFLIMFRGLKGPGKKCFIKGIWYHHF